MKKVRIVAIILATIFNFVLLIECILYDIGMLVNIVHVIFTALFVQSCFVVSKNIMHKTREMQYQEMMNKKK